MRCRAKDKDKKEDEEKETKGVKEGVVRSGKEED